MNEFLKINLGWEELLKLIYFYGARYIIPLIFIAVFLYLIYKNKIHFDNDRLKTIFLLSIIMFMCGVYQLFLLLNAFISHGSDRITNLNYAIFPMIPLFALSLYYIVNIFSKSGIKSYHFSGTNDNIYIKYLWSIIFSFTFFIQILLVLIVKFME